MKIIKFRNIHKIGSRLSNQPNSLLVTNSENDVVFPLAMRQELYPSASPAVSAAAVETRPPFRSFHTFISPR